MEKIKILLADDHAILRDGIKAVLETDANFEIAAEADNGNDAIRLSAELKPDIAILDINMPYMNGIEATKVIKKSNSKIKIIILTMYENENYILDAMSAGVNGYMSKMCDMEEFLLAVRSVANGKDYFHQNVSKVLMKNYLNNVKKQNGPEELKIISLTKREKEILGLIVEGSTNQQISEKLHISYFTVGQHRKNIMHKLELKNTADLVRYVIEHNIL